jgi:rod shape-determining protein MreC
VHVRATQIEPGAHHPDVVAEVQPLAPAARVGLFPIPGQLVAERVVDDDRLAAAVEEALPAVAVGTGDGLRLEYVSGSADIERGDTVITSGIDGIYPKGFVIGRVEQIERSGGAYGAITVSPAVNLSMLEEVLVVLTPPLPDAAPSGVPQ